MPGPIIDSRYPLLAKPGAYLITHLETGRRYVGISQNVKKRVAGHFSGQAPTRLKRAIKKYGKDAFSAEAVCYSIDGQTAHLPALEAELIAANLSVGAGGFNVKAADGGVGPYGAEFGALIRAHHAVPENRKRMLAARADAGCSDEAKAIYAATAKANWADPEIRARMIAGMRVAANREETLARRRTPERLAILKLAGQKARSVGSMEKLRAAHIARLSDPAVRQEIGRASRERWRCEEYRAKRKASDTIAWESKERRAATSAAISGLVWINNGERCARIKLGEIIPPGWIKGRIGLPKDLVWITDGSTNRRVQRNVGIPLGWRYGATQIRKAVSA